MGLLLTKPGGLGRRQGERWGREPLPLTCLRYYFAMANENALKNLSDAELTSLKKKFIDWFSTNHQKELNILITGKAGVGKSRLVNALVGRHVAEEGRQREAKTSDVTPYCVVIAGINVFVWDSPGLHDGTCDEEVYLAKLAAKVNNGFDVMLYCIKMDDKRFYAEDKRAMKALTQAFGENLWKKGLIALTFANRVEDPDERDNQAYFTKELTLWKEAINKFLHSELNIADQVRNQLPVVPAGNYRKLCLPTDKNWLAQLWIKCLSVMDYSAGLAFFKINIVRLKFSFSTLMSRVLICQPTNETPPSTDIPGIDMDEEDENTFLSYLWKAFLVGTGVVGGVLLLSFTVMKLLFGR